MAIAFDLVGQQWQRKIIVVAAAAVGDRALMAMRPVSPEGAYWHEAVERSGIFLILVGILGRTWCAMYIGGNKLNRLVTEGPYSLTRNPLYVFSAIAAFGLGAQLGSVVFALICAAATLAIFALVISHEERALAERFPGEFARYKARVPRLAARTSADGRTPRPSWSGRPWFTGPSGTRCCSCWPRRPEGARRPAGRLCSLRPCSSSIDRLISLTLRAPAPINPPNGGAPLGPFSCCFSTCRTPSISRLEEAGPACPSTG